MTVAVFLPNWIGDVVMATPAIRALRKQFAGKRLVGVLKPYVAGVLEGSPWLDALVYLDSKGPWNQGWLAAANRLRAERVQLSVLFPNTLRSALVAWISGSAERIGVNRRGRGMLLTKALEPVRDAQGRLTPHPILDVYNQLAEQVGCPAPGTRMELFTTEADEAAADGVWRQAGFEGLREVICLNPGAAFGSSKYWPVEYFSTLARGLSERRGCGVLVLCGPSERALAQEIATRAGHPRVYSLDRSPLSLGLTKACIRRSHLLVTTDSGPRHFGVAFDRPTLTLFGPTHIAWTETYHARSVHLQKKVECGPCQKRVCPLDHRCMRELMPEEVLGEAETLLKRFPSSLRPAC